MTSWNGLASRAGLPDSILHKLSGLIVTALQDLGLQDRALELGIDPRGSTPEQMRDPMRRHIERWRTVIEKANIAMQ